MHRLKKQIARGSGPLLPFVCGCGTTFSNVGSLASHQKSTCPIILPPSTVHLLLFECTCGQMLSDHPTLMKHQQASPKHVICACGKIMQTFDHLVQHIGELPNHLGFICGCGDRFVSPVARTHHQGNSRKHAMWRAMAVPPAAAVAAVDTTKATQVQTSTTLIICECGSKHSSKQGLNTHRNSDSRKHARWKAMNSTSQFSNGPVPGIAVDRRQMPAQFRPEDVGVSQSFEAAHASAKMANKPASLSADTNSCWCGSHFTDTDEPSRHILHSGRHARESLPMTVPSKPWRPSLLPVLLTNISRTVAS